jgi:hypothetical protein
VFSTAGGGGGDGDGGAPTFTVVGAFEKSRFRYHDVHKTMVPVPRDDGGLVAGKFGNAEDKACGRERE